MNIALCSLVRRPFWEMINPQHAVLFHISWRVDEFYSSMKQEKGNDKTTQKPVEQMGLILPKFTITGGNAFIFAILYWGRGKH